MVSKLMQNLNTRYKNGESVRLLFVCHGNICRSTMAECVMTHLVKDDSARSLFVIDSAATSTEEIGNGIHYGTQAVLSRANIPLVPHRARQITARDYESFDAIIGMDTANIRNMKRFWRTDDECKIVKLLDFVTGAANGGMSGAPDVLDPWYTNDFNATLIDVLDGCRALYNGIVAR